MDAIENAPTPGAIRDEARGASVGSQPAYRTLSQRPAPIGGNLADPFLARLDGVIPAGTGRWYARCPAHDDRSPSLSVREDGERVLIHCFAVCDPDDILTAVGLRWSDLYPDRWECARLRPNEAAARYARRTLAAMDPLDLERAILRLAAADRRAGRPESVVDRARTHVAVERLRAAGGV